MRFEAQTIVIRDQHQAAHPLPAMVSVQEDGTPTELSVAHQLGGLFVLRGRAWSLYIYYGITLSPVNHAEHTCPDSLRCLRPLALIVRRTAHAL